jgi:hypothetical protein
MRQHPLYPAALEATLDAISCLKIGIINRILVRLTMNWVNHGAMSITPAHKFEDL